MDRDDESTTDIGDYKQLTSSYNGGLKQRFRSSKWRKPLLWRDAKQMQLQFPAENVHPRLAKIGFRSFHWGKIWIQNHWAVNDDAKVILEIRI